ncbi:MAG: hypothetical protein KatS3mg061_1082 [Dehalococcoidia bacterium]|nr:MAG: hypothetical protein KatS3mg061_1082 [Dehalococcoidia bacterium]
MSRQSVRWIVALLAVATALIHWSLLLQLPDLLFFLNGLGYLALAFAYLTERPLGPERRQLLHGIFLGYTAITILAWVAVGERSLIGYLDKLLELLLVFFLVLSLRQERKP